MTADIYCQGRMVVIGEARRIIARAEHDLGPLTDGQRRDLLKDNTDWSSDTIAYLVDQIALAWATGRSEL